MEYNKEYSLKLLPRAEKDLESIFDYIFSDLSNPKAAADLMDKMEKAFEQVRSFPLSCPIGKSERNYRKLVVENYIVFYSVNEQKKSVIVFRVLYGMMDYDKYI
jgi:addiction module RelE/StbE family toxin